MPDSMSITIAAAAGFAKVKRVAISLPRIGALLDEPHSRYTLDPLPPPEHSPRRAAGRQLRTLVREVRAQIAVEDRIARLKRVLG